MSDFEEREVAASSVHSYFTPEFPNNIATDNVFSY